MIIKETDVHLATDIRDVLNKAGGKVDNEVTSFFQPDAKLNPWSKWKPVKWRELFTDLTFAEGEVPWWKGYDYNCGFVASSIIFNDLDSLVAAYQSGQTYVYDLPDEDWPKRVGDFRRYNTDARSPVWSFSAHSDSGGMFENNPQSRMTFDLLWNLDIDTNYNLTLQDIGTLPEEVEDELAKWQYGVIVVKGNDPAQSAVFSSGINVEGFPDTTAEAMMSMTITLEELRNAGGSGVELGTVNTTHFVYPVLMSVSPKRFLACPVAPVSFAPQFDPTFLQIEWTTELDADEKSLNYYQMRSNGRMNFYGKLIYNETLFEGQTVHISVTIYKADGTILENQAPLDITLKADGVYDDVDPDNRSLFMNVPPIGEQIFLFYAPGESWQGQDQFYLVCSYWQGSGNQMASIETKCDDKTDRIPE